MCCCINARPSRASKQAPHHAKPPSLKAPRNPRAVQQAGEEPTENDQRSKHHHRDEDDDDLLLSADCPNDGSENDSVPSIVTDEKSAATAQEEDATTSTTTTTTTSNNEKSAISRVVDSVRNQVETDQQQREDIEGLQLGMERLRQLNYENEQRLQHLLCMRGRACATTAGVTQPTAESNRIQRTD